MVCEIVLAQTSFTRVVALGPPIAIAAVAILIKTHPLSSGTNSIAIPLTFELVFLNCWSVN
jgi:hypothetical protein